TKFSSAYSLISFNDFSATIRNTFTGHPAGICGAISESVITNSADRSPLSQLRSRQSRNVSASGSSPAATNIVLAQRRNSGQRETIATIESADGRVCPRIDSATDAELITRKSVDG